MYKVTIETGQPLPISALQKATAPLLSELRIQLPRPQPTKKTSVYREQVQTCESPKPTDLDYLQLKADSNCFLFSGTKTRNSSTSLPFRSESEIISEWVRNLFQKRQLLGPSWEVKLRGKRRELMRWALAGLKEYEPRQPSAYLQTQSRHRPYVSACNQLHILGLEKMSEIVPRLVGKTKQVSFSKILRFLAFQHMNRMTRSRQQESMTNPISNRDSREFTKEFSPRAVHGYAGRESQDEQGMDRQSRQMATSRQTEYLDNQYNQYALGPALTLTHPDEEGESTPRNSHRKTAKYSHGLAISRQSVPKYEYQSQPVIDPHFELMKMKESQYAHGLVNANAIVNTNPPSPNAHHFRPVATPHVIFTHPQKQPVQLVQNYQNSNNPLRQENTRKSAHLRPHSHHPFTNMANKSRDANTYRPEPERKPESRSRAHSASTNLKISFTGSNPQKQLNYHQPKALPNDYEGEQAQVYPQLKKMHKLGTVQNRQMRQSYQVNNVNNQLIPPDYHRTPNMYYSPQMYSSPITPKAVHSPVARGYISPAATTAIQITHGLGKVPSKRPKETIQQRSRQDNDYNFKRRQKLVVTSSKRRH